MNKTNLVTITLVAHIQKNSDAQGPMEEYSLLSNYSISFKDSIKLFNVIYLKITVKQIENKFGKILLQTNRNSKE